MNFELGYSAGEGMFLEHVQRNSRDEETAL
jgi:hypothetical protein